MINRQLAKLFDVPKVNYRNDYIAENDTSDAYDIRTQPSTPKECMKAVELDGMALQYVKDPTPEIILAAVKQCGYALQFVQNQTQEIILEAIKTNAFSSKFIQTQFLTPEFQKLLVAQSCACIRWLINPSEELYLIAIGRERACYPYTPLEMRTNEFNIKAVTQKPGVLSYIHDQTPELCRIAVAADSTQWEYAKYQPMDLIETVCELHYDIVEKHTLKIDDDYFIAICKKQPRYAAFITPTEENYHRAFKRNPLCLRFMSVQPITVQFKAIEQDPLCIRFAKNQTPELQQTAVELDPEAIRYCENPSFELCKSAVKSDPTVVSFISELIIEKFLFQEPVSVPVPTTDLKDLARLIDQVTVDKIPSASALDEISCKIIESGLSVDNKAVLLKKLFQF